MRPPGGEQGRAARPFPRGCRIDRVVHSNDIRLFSVPAVLDRAEVICFRCGQTSHVKNECMHWKTRLCWHFATGRCQKSNCPFAHGEHEMREPWMLKCVRIVKTDAGFENIGCSSPHHSFRHCPHAAGGGGGAGGGAAGGDGGSEGTTAALSSSSSSSSSSSRHPLVPPPPASASSSSSAARAASVRALPARPHLSSVVTSARTYSSVLSQPVA